MDSDMENKTQLQDQTVQSTMLLPVYGRAKASRMSPGIRKVESVSFFRDLRKEKRFKLSTRINMWGPDKMKMGSLIGIRWGAAK
jgi:hypothetical protein